MTITCEVVHTCNRCDTKFRVPEGSGIVCPPGWSQVEHRNKDYDLCADCSQDFERFIHNFDVTSR